MFNVLLKIQEPAFFILPGETAVVKNLECSFMVESKNMNKRSHSSRPDVSLSLPVLLTGAGGLKVRLRDELTFQVLQSAVGVKSVSDFQHALVVATSAFTSL